MTRPIGIHHLALSTKNIKAQIAFFSDVLGMELVALFWMHGVPGGWHGFMKLDDCCYLAFVQLVENAEIESKIGVTHAGNGASPCAGGTMQHLAFDVADEDALLAMRDRIRSRGVNVFGPIDHGMCKSIYFAGPENLTLEIATSSRPVDARAWIDPEVVERAGISAEELARFKNPEPFASRRGSVGQPPIDPDKPRMHYPAEVYRAMVAMSDAKIAEQASYAKPPVDPD